MGEGLACIHYMYLCNQIAEQLHVQVHVVKTFKHDFKAAREKSKIKMVKTAALTFSYQAKSKQRRAKGKCSIVPRKLRFLQFFVVL